ncbi:hypothetical protein [Paracoccus sediminicola]|uniref:hypothetical protein n=1 Tax=Paracoccus sediminicola TaxID=3017783 RepID=UPI0022F06125|nr:hypothetical protein [Paracoccus sediminicola]WBU57259.1 hypothetical protein PAF18_02085 [Paracoccus sediminicola]
MAEQQSRLGIDSISEFYHAWPGLRAHAVKLVGDERLSPAQRETLAWLVVIADRVGPADLDDAGAGDGDTRDRRP